MVIMVVDYDNDDDDGDNEEDDDDFFFFYWTETIEDWAKMLVI